ncbi:hypothetical protein BGZ60DRAFT_419284 [Tricladium varicosporioides]|nr:hypothetical protein BGZ60DRAFT_419284 [Hymenoscyphus varicosporioides]
MGSDTDRNKDSKDTPQDENPFIKFRKFADAQIGSFLQGVLGLPSALSKSSGNARWADFDEEMRRRDELQARKQQLKDAEAQRIARQDTGRSSEEAVSIPVKKWPNPQERSSNLETQSDLEDEITHDVPLFSPVEKRLFAELLPPEDSRSPEWRPSDFIRTLSKGFLPECWPYMLQPNQKSSNVMRMIQCLALNDLQARPDFASEYSLLPYLLFSSYSPIRLSQDAHASNRGAVFPWCSAFEDLIETAHGPEVCSWTPGLSAFRPMFSWDPRIQSAVSGVAWIHELYGRNMLQQKESKSMKQQVVWLDPWSSPILQHVLQDFDSHYDRPESEQEMYDHFLQWISATAETPTIPLLSEVESQVHKTIGSADGNRKLREVIDTYVPKHMKDEMSNILDKIEKLARDNASTTIEPPKEQTIRAVGEKEESKSTEKIQDPKRVISTSTTSEQHTTEEGSVETTVTIWKRFADGSESWTTTTHYEDGPAPSNPEKETSDVVKETQDKPKKGWFWN